jgi:hypothetical protein
MVMAVAAVVVVAADPKFLSVWKSPDVSRLSFAGKKVAALVITDDQSLQMSGEEALTRELTARGVTGVATYRIAPREELKTADKAKVWFERAAIEGVVALRPVHREIERSRSPVVWASGYYQSYWGYYDYGYSSISVAPVSREITTMRVIVETLVFDLKNDRLVWAATSAAENPETLQSFVKELVSAAVKEMKKMKLVA